MSRIDEWKGRIRTDSGSIDFDYYGTRARQLRADAFADTFRKIRSWAPSYRRVRTDKAMASPCA